MTDYKWWEAFIALPLLLALGSLLAQFELWLLVTEEAFRKFSKTRRRKTLARYSLGEKLLLRFAPEYNSSGRLRRRLALYYAYALLSAAVIAGPPLCMLFPAVYSFSRITARVWGIATFAIVIYYGFKSRADTRRSK